MDQDLSKVTAKALRETQTELQDKTVDNEEVKTQTLLKEMLKGVDNPAGGPSRHFTLTIPVLR